MVTLCTIGFKYCIKYSTIYLHNVFICFYGSQNKQRTLRYTSLLTDFITETESVYCVVRAESLNIIIYLYV